MTGEELTRELRLLGRDVLVTRGLDVPLRHSPLPLEHRDDVREVGRRLLSLCRLRACRPLPPTVCHGRAITVPTMPSQMVLGAVAVSMNVSTGISVPFPPHVAVIVVSSRVPAREASVPLPATVTTTSIAAGVAILAFTLTVVPARGVGVGFVVATRRTACSKTGRAGAPTFGVAVPVASTVPFSDPFSIAVPVTVRVSIAPFFAVRA